MFSAGSSPDGRTRWMQTNQDTAFFRAKHNQIFEKKRPKNDLRINLEQVIILGVGSEEVGDADHGAAKGPPVLHTTLVLLLAGSHPPCTTGAKK